MDPLGEFLKQFLDDPNDHKALTPFLRDLYVNNPDSKNENDENVTGTSYQVG